MSKTGFKDLTAVKKRHPENVSEKDNRSFWDHKQPDYDERTSCFMNAGTHYGVGEKVPVGKARSTSHFGDGKAIPFGRPKTLGTDEIG